jgi:hypothetical protein
LCVIDPLIGVVDGLFSIILIVFCFIRASTFVAHRADAFIVVPGDDGYASLSDQIHHFIGPNIISDEVSEAVDGIRLLFRHAFEAGFEGRQIGVYIAEERNSHD